jgi:hypothetical protein
MTKMTKSTKISHEAPGPTKRTRRRNVCSSWFLVGLVASCEVFVCFGASVGCRAQRPPSITASASSSLHFAIDGRSNGSPAVAAYGKRIAVVWTASTEAASDIYLSVSVDNGATFAPPVRVNDVEGDARASGEQPARVVMDKTIHVVWPSKDDGRPVIRYARSTDDGRTFSKAATAAGGGLSGARGWHAAAIGYDGGMHLVWLDGRHAAPHQHEHGKPTPKATAMRQAPRQDVFHASWKGDAARAENPVAANVCFCCKTAVVASGERVYVAWRHIFPGSIRDIAVARSDDNGVTFGAPARLSEDGWKLDACPDDGPAMAADTHGGVHVVWPTLVAGDPPRKGIFYASRGHDEGTFTPRLRLDSGEADPSHPQIASDDHGNTAIVWDEHAGGVRRIVLRPVSNGAAQTPQMFTGEGVSYPVAAAAEGQWIVLWSGQTADGRSAIDGRRIPF